MGAMPWQIAGPYHPDPASALRAVQAERFKQNYDLKKLLEEHIANVQDSVRYTETDDEYGLLETYRENLTQLDEIKCQPLPTDIHEQVKLLRQIEAIGSGEIGNILDIESVSKSREPRKVVPLSSQELQDLFGTIHPSREHVTAERLDKIYNTIDRGEAVCFPIFERPPSQQPIGWFFVGYTVD
ncbi:MAG TPA: hypothetical protein VMP01_27550 [Pirellulaceae bacterium]|nr:hypothetical protein [Pirellulaceae bacterium]